MFEDSNCLKQTGSRTSGGIGAHALTASAGDRLISYSIVVCARRNAALDELARSLRSQTVPTDHAEIVITGGRRSSAARPLVNRLEGPWRVRFVDAWDSTLVCQRNGAARVASHELLLFLAEDFIPGPTWLASHLRLHACRPEPSVVGIGPLLLDANAPSASFARWLEDGSRCRGPGLGLPCGFHAANTSMKRSFLRAAGGFDEALSHDGTCDFELGLRLRELGMQTISLDDATAFRRGRTSLAQRWRRMRQAGESAVVLRMRHSSDATLPAQPEASASVHLRGAFAASLRWLAGRGSADRDLAWHHFLGAAFASGFERGRARFAGNGDQLPPLPRPTTHELPTLEALAGGREDCRWAADHEPGGVGGLQPVNVFDGYGLEVEENGARCLSFRNPAGAPQAYFAIDRFHSFTERTVEIEIDLLAGAAETSVRVEYDSTDRSVRLAPNVPGAFKSTAAQSVAACRDWQTLRFTINDARFCRSLNGTDFRVVSTGTLETHLVVRRARVSVRESDRARALSGSSRIEFPENPSPRVSIIIPTRDRLDLLRQCLLGLHANTPQVYEVIVVVDGSSQGRISNSLDNVAGLCKVRLPVNVGFARACNVGAAQARAPLLLFLNDDTVPLAGWLEALTAALEQDARVGVAGSRLLYPRLGLVQHAGVEIDPTGQPFHAHRLEPSEKPEVNEDRILPAVTGACLLIRRQLFERLHGFDVGFRNGYEDIDLCLRARGVGALTLYCNRSILLHYESASEGLKESDLVNKKLFLRRWGNRALGDLKALGATAHDG